MKQHSKMLLTPDMTHYSAVWVVGVCLGCNVTSIMLPRHSCSPCWQVKTYFSSCLTSWNGIQLPMMYLGTFFLIFDRYSDENSWVAFNRKCFCTGRFTIAVCNQAARPTAYLGIAERHQVNNHDVIQEDCCGEEHHNEKLSAPRTQTLVVKPHLNRIVCLLGLCVVGMKARLQNLQQRAKQGGQLLQNATTFKTPEEAQHQWELYYDFSSIACGCNYLWSSQFQLKMLFYDLKTAYTDYLSSCCSDRF